MSLCEPIDTRTSWTICVLNALICFNTGTPKTVYTILGNKNNEIDK